jgi:hypothetical protein
MMKAAIISGGVAVAIVAAAGVFLYLPSDQDVRNDAYARICKLLTERQLDRPSSMEVTNVLVVWPKEMTKEAALLQMKERFNNQEKYFDSFLIEIEEDYSKSRPYRIVDTYLTYSTLNALGGAAKNISQCAYTEKPDYKGDFDSELTLVSIGGVTIRQGSPEWNRVVGPADLLFDRVEIGLMDRVHYVFARTNRRS